MLRPFRFATWLRQLKTGISMWVANPNPLKVSSFFVLFFCAHELCQYRLFSWPLQSLDVI